MKLGMVLAGSSCSKPSGTGFKMGASFEFLFIYLNTTLVAREQLGD